jgi:hypothetical protein
MVFPCENASVLHGGVHYKAIVMMVALLVDY